MQGLLSWNPAKISIRHVSAHWPNYCRTAVERKLGLSFHAVCGAFGCPNCFTKKQECTFIIFGLLCLVHFSFNLEEVLGHNFVQAQAYTHVCSMFTCSIQRKQTVLDIWYHLNCKAVLINSPLPFRIQTETGNTNLNIYGILSHLLRNEKSAHISVGIDHKL